MNIHTNDKKIIRICIALLMITLLSILPASAFDYHTYWWHNEHAGFDMDSSVPSSWWGALDSAMDEWNDAPSDFYYEWDSSSTSCFYYENLPQESWYAQCRPFVYSSDKTSISKMLITFNGKHTWSTASTCPSQSKDVQSTATHELGHALGLKHSTYTAATMWPYGALGDISKRTLHFDDEDGIEHIYG